MALIDLFDRGWAMASDRPAFIKGDETWTYDEVGRLSCRVANALIREGAGAETKVAVLAPNDIRAWSCVLGAWRSGAAWVPLNPAYVLDDTIDFLDRFDCEYLFVHEYLGDRIGPIRRALGDRLRVITLAGEAPIDDVETFEQFLDGASDERPGVRIDPAQLAMLSPTGGTTGKPKGVMNTHRSMGTCMAHLMLAMHYGAHEAPVNLAAAPMTHSAGVMTLPTAARGGVTVLIERPEIDAILDAIERHRVTELFLPPTVIYRMLDTPDIRSRDLSTMKHLIYSSAPMSTEKLRRCIELWGPVMMETFGQTEAPGTIAFLTADAHLTADGAIEREEVLRSCGRIAPLAQVEIRDNAGRPVPAGHPGEICVSGDLVMRGYYKNPEATAEAIVDGWLHTGDIGVLSADGYLTITDRKKDMIITGGFNVYPAEVEQVLWAHPAVQECAVVGLADPEWGERVTAFVELNQGHQADPQELIDWCRTRLGGIKTPKQIEIVDRLPRSMNGKVLKKDLRGPVSQGGR